jgi:integrase
MPKRAITDRMLKALKPARAGMRYDVMDAVVPGFGVRVTDRGQRTFILVARYPGRRKDGEPGARPPTRRALGEYGAISLDKARGRARGWIELIRQGIDPKLEEDRRRIAEQQRQENSFKSVAEDFFRLQVIGPDFAKPLHRKGAETKKDIQREFVSRWGSRPITDITPADVVAVIDEVVARGAKYQAHNLLGHVRRLFNWAIARRIYGLEKSPCDRMKPRDVIGKKLSRKRVLNNDELRAFWRATESLGYPYGPLFRMLALTIQRKSQVAEAQRPEFDFGQAIWTLGADRMKGDEEAAAPHVVPLTPQVLTILKSLPEYKKGKYLFSTTFGASPVNGFSKAKDRLDELILAELRRDAEARGDDPGEVKLEPWVIHDLRRTGRTGLSALPIPDIVRELVIAHAKPGLHKVYDQFAYLDEKRHALELWAARLGGIVEPAPPVKNVVHFAARA